MTIIPPPLLRAIPPANALLRRFTVDEYHRLIEVGILGEDEPLELIEGFVRYKMPRNPIHDNSIEIVRRALDRVIPTTFSTRDQKTVTLSDSEPEPDISVVSGGQRFGQQHPGPADVALIAEVANTSLDFDRDEKGTIYAREDIPVYWVINLIGRQVEVYTDPDSATSPPVYRQRQDYPIGTSVPVVLRGQPVGAIAVQDLFP